MIRLFVCVLACMMALGTALPADPTPAAIIPPVGTTQYPFASPNPFAPGFNDPYYQYKYNPAAATAGPAIPILTYSNEHNGDGSYSFSFSTADGKQAQESGYLKDAYIDNNGEPQGTQVVQGSYSYVSPEGTPIQVTYIADENGFRPSGVHIPADGKAVVPPVFPFADGRNRSIYDPELNRYNNPYYNNNRFGLNRGYDPRYPYDPRRPYDQRYNSNPLYNRINPFRPIPLDVKEQPKKE